MSPRKENEIVWWAVGLRVEPMQTGAERKTLEAKKTSYKENNLEAKKTVCPFKGVNAMTKAGEEETAG